MTNGTVVVLGTTGRNFAAGMSGGLAFVLDERGDFPSRCNLQMVGLEPLAEAEDLELVRDLLIQHAGYTGSSVAARLLSDWDRAVDRFVKVMPLDYRRVLEERKRLDDEAREAMEQEQQVEVARG